MLGFNSRKKGQPVNYSGCFLDFGVVFVGFGINVMEKKVLRSMALTVEKKQPESYAGCFFDLRIYKEF